MLFSVAQTNRVESGHTLVVGGWPMKGARAYLLVKPVINPLGADADVRPLTIETHVVLAPVSHWEEIGWGDAISESRRSALACVLKAEQAEILLEGLRTRKGAEITTSSEAHRGPGEYLGLGWSTSDDQEEGMLLGVDVHPWISPDGRSVDLEMQPSKVDGETRLHPILGHITKP